MTTASREPLVYKPAELVEILHVGENQVYELIASGRIPAIKWGPRQIVIPARALQQFLDEEAFRQQQERLQPSERQLVIADTLQRQRERRHEETPRPRRRRGASRAS